jgi:16S rRNA (guanine966-N2)-methyltransferase
VTRVVAGSAGGRRLLVPTGSSTRPTSDRVREAMFSTLTTLLGTWDDARVLDLYAGSGALGIEALSRGADRCVFVENDRRAVVTIERNLAGTGLTGGSVVRAEVARFVAEPAETPFDLVLLDPPYALPAPDLVAALSSLVGNGWLAGDAVLAVERSSREPAPPWPSAMSLLRERRYGETGLWYLRGSDDSS